ncbi:MAG: hypothetical protein JST02_10125, partial [Bacteroidetes bacterium]|nr:hypothetical protein [Bacteroidota bacterium]
MAHYHTVEERLAEADRIIRAAKNPFIINYTKRRDLVAALDAVLKERQPRVALKTFQTYTSVLNKFAAWYRPAYKADNHLNPVDFINFLYSGNYSNSTIRKSLVVLKNFFNCLVKCGNYEKNPFVDLKIKKIRGKSKLPFHPEQVAELKAVIAARDPQLWQAVQFLYYLFFRPNEVRQLKISDILFFEQKIILRDEIAKDDDNILKAVPAPLLPVIDKLRGQPANYFIFSHNQQPGKKMISINNLNDRHRKILRSLNYSTRYSLYSWVHTGIKMAAMAGIPLKQ